MVILVLKLMVMVAFIMDGANKVVVMTLPSRMMVMMVTDH